jgi:DUF4097 and DUF4098 domain-containing protein YvlB
MMRSRFRLFSLVPAILVLAVLGAGCDVSVGEHGFSMDIVSGKAQDEWTRTYAISAGGRLAIENINGTIDASPAEGGQVEVRAERLVKARTDEAARELLKQLEIAEEVSGDSVRLETKAPRVRGTSHQVRYIVKVPKGIAVNFEMTNGRVRLENLEGEIVASTTNGGVTGTGLRGAVNASSTNGGVQIEMAEVTGAIDLETTNGGIRLQLPRDAKANLEARCVNGGISLSGFELQGETTRRRVSGAINGGGPRVSVETTNGGVRISAAGAAETN